MKYHQCAGNNIHFRLTNGCSGKSVDVFETESVSTWGRLDPPPPPPPHPGLRIYIYIYIYIYILYIYIYIYIYVCVCVYTHTQYMMHFQKCVDPEKPFCQKTMIEFKTSSAQPLQVMTNALNHLTSNKRKLITTDCVYIIYASLCKRNLQY